MPERDSNTGPWVGRAAVVNPVNRFESTRQVDDHSHLDPDESAAQPRRVPTVFLPDESRQIFAENNSPDVPFRFSINPYRGCEHGCAYCYARCGHEFLGMNAGLDFESKIVVKFDAARLLRDALNQPDWEADVVSISGVTDCYQPAERRFRITRSLLEVMLEARQPLGITTKNALVLRDIDLLAPLARRNLVAVNISLTSLDQELTKVMEPRTSSPQARLKAIAQLTAAGIPVRVMTAPIIPGLNDHELPRLLTAAKEAGAQGACYILLHLPLSVEPVFLTWLRDKLPERREIVESRIKATRGGKYNDSRFGSRMKGEGAYAQSIGNTFNVFARKLGLDGPFPPLDQGQFRPPRTSSGQMRLF